jgi:iron complex transport system substrate-binding protein
VALVMASATALAEMSSRPGWRSMQALQQRQTCGFAAEPFDALVRPGPRLADAAEAIAGCLAALGTIRP